MQELLCVAVSGALLFWTKAALLAGGSFAVLVGALSFVSPKRSIGLYQSIMRTLNWQVEPIDWEHELRSTRRLGALLSLLSAAVLVLVLTW